MSCGRIWVERESRECWSCPFGPILTSRFADEKEMDDLKELMEDLKNAD